MIRHGWMVVLGLMTMMTAEARGAAGPWAIAVHGGAIGRAENLTDADREATRASLEKALDIGRKILADGGSSLDAVEQVVRALEDDPRFNAGRGAVLNGAGRHELDASIMEGHSHQCGAVAGVRTVKNPITLARRVMEKTRHVLLAGDGAEKFADEQQVERAGDEYFRIPARVRELESIRRAEQGKESGSAWEGHMGTVGCVALDQQGHLAAATSTGGLVNKKWGRIGDSPIIGAGTYADDATCAVSCTGIGEEYIRRSIAYDVSAQMRYRGASLDDAVRDAIDARLPRSSGGIIAVGKDGRLSARFNTPGLSRALADSGGRREIRVGD